MGYNIYDNAKKSVPWEDIMRYMKDVIGDDYKDWTKGTGVLIASQTGTGKTTFILEKLLTHAAENNKYVVYVCNRKSLNNQMREIIMNNLFGNDSEIKPEDIRYLIIKTYQECEKNGDIPEIKDFSGMYYDTVEEKFLDKYVFGEFFTDLSSDSIMYYVFDEAHYFVSDSLFNENTNQWGVQRLIAPESVSVFLTATPEPLAIYLELITQRAYWFPKKQLDEMFYWHRHRRYVSSVIERNGHNPIQELRRYKQSIPLYGLFHQESIVYPLALLYRKPENVRSTLPVPHLFGHRKLQYFKPEIVKKEMDRALSERFRRAVYFTSMCLEGLDNRSSHFFPKSQIFLNQIDYSYLDIWYFDDYCELIKEIQESSDKWVFFVDSIKEGKQLANSIKKTKENVVFLTADSRDKIDSEEHKTFTQIEKEQRFDCDVLITTRVLDCGVSLTDKAIKNIVIDEKDITEFIQMIGRRRCQGEDDKIRCFIKHIGNGEWHQKIALLERNLDFIADFYNAQFPDINHPEQNIDIVPVLMKIKSNQYSDLIIVDPYSPFSPAKVAKEFSVNMAVFVNHLYNYTILWRARQQEKPNEYPYLNAQVMRLGHEYNQKRWYGYETSVDALRKILVESKQKGDMSETDRETFIKDCLDVISNIQKVHLPQNMIDVIKKYKKRNPDSNECIKVSPQSLNKTFKELGLPYQVVGRQKGKNERKTSWTIIDITVSNEEEEMAQGKTEEKEYILDVIEKNSLVFKDGILTRYNPIKDPEYVDLEKKGGAEYLKRRYGIEIPEKNEDYYFDRVEGAKGPDDIKWLMLRGLYVSWYGDGTES